jgi:hypothetical protein
MFHASHVHHHRQQMSSLGTTLRHPAKTVNPLKLSGSLADTLGESPLVSRKSLATVLQEGRGRWESYVLTCLWPGRSWHRPR